MYSLKEVTYSPPTHNGAGNHRMIPVSRVTFRVGSTSERQPLLVLTVHWWPAPICVGGLLHALMLIITIKSRKTPFIFL